MSTRRRSVRWLFIGDGALYERLKAAVSAQKLSNVDFKPYQPRERLAESLCAIDVHLVSLRPELEGLIVPSKFYGIAAAGRPTIFIGDPDGEIARLITKYECGLTVRQGDGAGLAEAVLELASNPALLKPWASARAKLSMPNSRNQLPSRDGRSCCKILACPSCARSMLIAGLDRRNLPLVNFDPNRPVQEVHENGQPIPFIHVDDGRDHSIEGPARKAHFLTDLIGA